jgi:hypothetical protein
MGVHPGPSVVRAKGFLTGDVDQRRDYNPNGNVLDPGGCKGARACGAQLLRAFPPTTSLWVGRANRGGRVRFSRQACRG